MENLNASEVSFGYWTYIVRLNTQNRLLSIINSPHCHGGLTARYEKPPRCRVCEMIKPN